MKLTTLLAATIFLYSNITQAKVFSNSYISFELPKNWSCTQKRHEDICVNIVEGKKAIIALTAKKKGARDSLSNYEKHLKKARVLKNHKQEPYTSKVKLVKKRRILNVDWIESVHLGSEIQNYYTRYAATVTNDIGILATFSAHKDHYSKHVNDFMRAIQSLKVTAPTALSKNLRNSQNSDLFSDSGISETLPNGLYGDLEEAQQNYRRSNSSLLNLFGSKGLIGILLLLITGLGAFIYIKAR